MNAIETAIEFFGIQDASPELVEVADWGCAVHIRDMHGDEVEHVGRLRGDKKPLMPWLLKYSVCDAGGKDLFATIADAEKACKKSAKGLNVLIEAINRRNGFAGDLEGNSQGGASGDSRSD